MTVAFLTPLGALLALAVLIPLAALLAVRRRAGRVRRNIGLREPSARRLLVPLAALLAAAGLLGLAASQPVVERTTTRHVRTDAEAFVVLDVSRSMLARRDKGGRIRLVRAKAAASELRASLPGVPVGIASVTDRVLPHLFPTVREDLFEATLERSIGIERPPPGSSFLTNATKLDGLEAIRTRRFFSPKARRRLLVVLTDGESQPIGVARLGAIFRRPPAIQTVYVHLWDEDERVFTRGLPEPQYRPDSSARSILDGLAKATGGSVYSEGEVGAAARKAGELLGEGPTAAQGERRGRIVLAPYLAVAVFLPLTLLLVRRDR